MTKTEKGWVVLTESHGLSGREILVSTSFARTRQESIQLFIQDTNTSWELWKRVFNYKCVRAEMNISTYQKPKK